MAKDPAFLFYSQDFLTGTMFMSNEQVGIYIRLLIAQHQQGGLIDKLSFDSLVGDNKIVRSKFIESEHGYYNKRLSIEMELRSKKSTNISDAAKETWKKRKEIEIQSYNDRITTVIRPENENEDIIKKGGMGGKKEKLTPENFYQSELEKSGSNEKYQAFINFLFKDNDLNRPLSSILSIRDQLTFAEFGKLNKLLSEKAKLGTPAYPYEILLKMENDKKYTKGKVSLYLTLINWINQTFVK